MTNKKIFAQSLLVTVGLCFGLINPAYSQDIPDYCSSVEDSGGSTFVLAETEGFYINICGGDLPNTYIGIDKEDPDNLIVLPLTDYDAQGDYFEALNGDVSYLLIRGTTKGDFLTVTQGDQELFRQPILYWE